MVQSIISKPLRKLLNKYNIIQPLYKYNVIFEFHNIQRYFCGTYVHMRRPYGFRKRTELSGTVLRYPAMTNKNAILEYSCVQL